MRNQSRESDRSRRFRRGVGPVAVVALMVLAALATVNFLPTAGATHPPDPTLKVPTAVYPTIQSAINAAKSGDTILVAPGTYVEQLTVSKSVTILGSGAGKTIIRSPAVLAPDAFGSPWTIEINNEATVTLSGFTLQVTLQCILLSGLPPVPIAHPHIGVYAGGGIGVGGSAALNLESAVVTTHGAAEGAACGSSPAGEMSYGTGVDFGLDFVTGSPAASQLIGTGTVWGVSVSGFGFAGPGVSIGGLANSPAGSSAVVSNDRIATSAADAGFDDTPSSTAPAISVGFGGNPSSATIIGNAISTLLSSSTDGIDVFSGSSVYIAHNSIQLGAEQDAVVLFSSTGTVTGNSIAGSTTDFSGGIVLWVSSATVTFNSLSNFACDFNAALAAGGFCGPSDATQVQVVGIFDVGDAGLGTVIENNLIFNADVGIGLIAGVDFGLGTSTGCPGCVVKDNLIIGSDDYGLDGTDGSYSFLQNLVVGGLYGVASVSIVFDTTVTLSHVITIGQSVAPPPYYFENDCLTFFGYDCTTTIVGN